jgi:hypothetical protein
VSAVLESLCRRLSSGATVLDVSYVGFRQAKRLGLDGPQHAGVDYSTNPDVPPTFDSRRPDPSTERPAVDDDTFDLAVASPVIEQRALLLSRMPFAQDQSCLLFLHDQSHVRRPRAPHGGELESFSNREPRRAQRLFPFTMVWSPTTRRIALTRQSRWSGIGGLVRWLSGGRHQRRTTLLGPSVPSCA